MGILISYDVERDYKRMDLMRKALIQAGWEVHGYTPIPNAKSMNEAMMAAMYQASALKKAELLIVLLTPKSAKDEMVEDEINYALEHQIPILPVLLDPTPKNLIRPALYHLIPLDATKDYNLAITELVDNLAQALELDVYDVALRFFNAGLRLNNNSDLELKAYTHAIEVCPDFAPAYNNRGHIYAIRKQYDLALADLVKAISFDEDNEAYRLQRASIFRKMQRFEEAIADCSYVLTKNPKSSDAWMNRANIYQEMNDFNRALQDYSQAIQIDATNYLIYHNRGGVFKLLRKYLEAEKDFKKAIELQPDWAEAYRKLGLLYHSMGNHKLAVEMCKIVLQKDQKHPNAEQMRDYIRKYS